MGRTKVGLTQCGYVHVWVRLHTYEAAESLTENYPAEKRKIFFFKNSHMQTTKFIS